VKSIIIYILFLMFLFSADKLPAGNDPLNISTETTEEKVKFYTIEGMKSSFSENFDLAFQYYDSALALDKNNLRTKVYRSTVFLYKYILTRDDNFKDKYLDESDIITESAEKLLSKNENDVKALSSLAANFGYRSMFYANDDSFLRSAWEGKLSYDYLKATLEKNPDDIEALMGMGIFNFSIGSIDPKMKSVMSFIGMSGDKNKGIEQLKTASEKAEFTKYEALFMLSQFYKYYEKDETKANEYYNKLIKENPSFSLFKKLDELKVYKFSN